jgi:hypothetical protein
MKRLLHTAFALALVASAVPSPAAAGGAWVPEPGKGDVQLGYSRKTAVTSWDASGDMFKNTTVFNGQRVGSYHDFRYGYLSGEIGLFKHLSGTFTVTYLDGLEGPKADMEENKGLSDAWFGLKYALVQGQMPMAIGFTYRTPMFYDIEGTYNRHLFDSQGRFRGVSPEWRGLLKHDYTLSYLVSRSIKGGGGWWNAQAGYTWREGAPADQIPVWADLGWPLPFWGSDLKLSGVYVKSLGNDSPRQPDDRFGSNATFNFNDASMARLGLALWVPFGPTREWGVEAGYNRWVWGESARRYKEPYLSISRRF